MLNEIGVIRLRDLELFEEVARALSIREAARRGNLSASQVSKAIQSLEGHLGTKLFQRSVSGVLLTNQGRTLRDLVSELLASADKMESLISGRNKMKFHVFAIAGVSFLNTYFTAPITCRFARERPEAVFRFLDLAPDQIAAVGLRGGFDLTVHMGPLSWPSTWSTNRLGKLQWTLCARVGHPLPKRVSMKQVLEYPFVVPTYWTMEGLVHGNDQFPIPLHKRKVGYETATADAAVPVLLETDQISFLPDLLVRPLIQAKRLRELSLEEIPVVEKELFLSVKSDLVPSSIFQGLTQKMRACLQGNEEG